MIGSYLTPRRKNADPHRRPRSAQVLYELVPFGYRQHLQLARSAAMHPMSLRAKLHEMSEDYIGKWTRESLRDGSPTDFGALASMGVTDAGVPVCYPSVLATARTSLP